MWLFKVESFSTFNIFFVAWTNVTMVWWFLSGVQTLFLFALNILLWSSISLLIESLKYAFSFISLKKLFKSLSSSFQLYTFGVIMRKFLFKSFYTVFEKENAVKLNTFISGSDVYLIVSSVFLHNLSKFSLCFWWMKLHSVFLFFLFRLLFGVRWSVFWTFLDFLFSLKILMNMIHVGTTCLIYLS